LAAILTQAAGSITTPSFRSSVKALYQGKKVKNVSSRSVSNADAMHAKQGRNQEQVLTGRLCNQVYLALQPQRNFGACKLQ
jgi:hypothetical protein